MDGTLYGELFPTYLEYYMLAWRILKDPSITPDAEMLQVGRTIRDCAHAARSTGGPRVCRPDTG